MDRWSDGAMDGSMDRSIDRWTDGSMDGSIDGQVDRLMDGWTDGPMDWWTIGCTEGMDRWMDEPMR